MQLFYQSVEVDINLPSSLPKSPRSQTPNAHPAPASPPYLTRPPPPAEEPGAPGRPEPTDWDKDFVDLKWEPPKNDGGAPITGYIVEKKEKGTGKWVKAVETAGQFRDGARVTNHISIVLNFKVMSYAVACLSI